jgi:hypothetical protein
LVRDSFRKDDHSQRGLRLETKSILLVYIIKCGDMTDILASSGDKKVAINFTLYLSMLHVASKNCHRQITTNLVSERKDRSWMRLVFNSNCKRTLTNCRFHFFRCRPHQSTSLRLPNVCCPLRAKSDFITISHRGRVKTISKFSISFGVVVIINDETAWISAGNFQFQYYLLDRRFLQWM